MTNFVLIGRHLVDTTSREFERDFRSELAREAWELYSNLTHRGQVRRDYADDECRRKKEALRLRMRCKEEHTAAMSWLHESLQHICEKGETLIIESPAENINSAETLRGIETKYRFTCRYRLPCVYHNGKYFESTVEEYSAFEATRPQKACQLAYIPLPKHETRLPFSEGIRYNAL